MVKLFMDGEPLYMSILTCMAVAMLFVSSASLHYVTLRIPQLSSQESRLKLIKEISLSALIFGLFSQFLGLDGALEAIEVWGKVEAEMLTQGIKISSIPLFYGLIIFLIGRALLIRKMA